MNSENRPDVRRYFFDTEFNDNPDEFRCELISIGVVDEDGKEYYGISNAFNRAAADERPWLKQHVIKKLDDPESWVSPAQMREKILSLIEPAREIELWSRNGSYDNVLLCQIFGGMGELMDTLRKEKGIQKVTFRDIKELHRAAPDIKIASLPANMAHSAINDARHERYCFSVLSQAIAFKEANRCKPGGMG
ncbi:MAG: 3'-5' exoribonuclease [Rhodospirillales bacterium]|nr:3'-5' exoribonuclease [Rhodospirillales bacterium]MCB9995738.1 3'-5' exoribonuclease [Rhodospirillales bacterium]